MSIGLVLDWIGFGVKRNVWPLRNFRLNIVCQLFCFSQ